MDGDNHRRLLLTAKDFYSARSLKDLSAFKVLGEIRAHRGKVSDTDFEVHLKQLDLPVEVFKYLKGFVQPICDSYHAWYTEVIYYFDGKESNVSHFVAKHGLHWKWCGIVDFEKMAKAIVGDDSIRILIRFYAACNYCMVPHIHRMWRLITDSDKYECATSSHCSDYWSMKLSGTLEAYLFFSEHEDEFVYGFSLALEQGNMSAIRYFWKRMDSSLKTFSKVVEYASRAFCKYMYQPHIVPFFMLKLRRQHQIIVFHYQLLQSAIAKNASVPTLLLWPWRPLFLPVLEAIIDSSSAGVSERNLQMALLDLATYHFHKIAPMRPSLYNLPELNCKIILKWWSLLDHSGRDSFFLSKLSFLYDLFDSGFTRCLDVMFDGISSTNLTNIVWSNDFSGHCREIILNDRIDTLKLILSYLKRDKTAIPLFKIRVAACAKDDVLKDLEPSFNVDKWSIPHVILGLEKVQKFLDFMDDHLKCIQLGQTIRELPTMKGSSRRSQVLKAKDFYWVRSLKDLSALKVLGEIRAHHKDISYTDCFLQLQQLDLPEVLLRYLKELIQPVDDTFREWYTDVEDQFFENSEYNVSRFVAKHRLHWMWCGIIDFEAMAKAVVGEEEIGVVQRFYLACEYCFVEDIYRLWEQLSNYDKADCGTSFRQRKYWTMKLNGTLRTFLDGSDFADEFVFGLSEIIDMGNMAAIRYFWDRMNDSVKTSENVVLYASKALNRYGCHPHIVPFFALKLSRREQIIVFHHQFLQVSNLAKISTPVLLRWPWRPLFLPLLEEIIASSSAGVGDRHLQTALLDMVNYLDSGDDITVPIRPSPFNLPRLNNEITSKWWSLLDKKTRMEFYIYDMSFLHDLFYVRYTECLSLIFKDLSSAELETVAFSSRFVYMCSDLVHSGSFEGLELVLTYLFPNGKRAIPLFKQKVAVCAKDTIFGQLRENNVNKWRMDNVVSAFGNIQRFLQFMDDHLEKQ